MGILLPTGSVPDAAEASGTGIRPRQPHRFRQGGNQAAGSHDAQQGRFLLEDPIFAQIGYKLIFSNIPIISALRKF